MPSAPTRRAVVARTVLAGISTGIAAAVRPPFAWAAPPAPGERVTQTHAVPTDTGTIPVHLARPAGPGPFPVILVVHEIFGVHAWIQAVCDKLAAEGFLAVAPYLYHRQGDVTQLASVEQILGEVVSKVSQEQVLADLDAVLAWAGAHAHADLTRASVTGFCWGGTVAWMYAAHRPDLRAAVAWYGRLLPATGPLLPRTPVDVAPTLTVPVLGLYGGQDGGIPLADVETMRQALAQGKSGSRIEVYPDAGHGFLADYRPSHHPASAALAWPAMLAWLRTHGAG